MTEFGLQWYYEASAWKTQNFYLEVYMKSMDGNPATVELFGDLQGSVPGSTVTTSSATFTRIRSAAMTLVNGNVYRARTTTNGNVSITGVKIVAI